MKDKRIDNREMVGSRYKFEYPNSTLIVEILSEPNERGYTECKTLYSSIGIGLIRINRTELARAILLEKI